MTTATIDHAPVRARPAGFLADCLGIATRSIRAVPREIEFVVPALVVPVFFYTINIGALGPLAEANTGLDFKAFQLPVAIIFAVTGFSRASALVTDIQNGYFDRLLMTPIRRLSLLLGLMMADLVLITTLSIPVVIMGFIVGVRFETGLPGVADLHLDGGLVGAGVHGLSVRDRAQDREPGGRQHQLHPVLPVRVPHHVVPAARRPSAGGSRRSPSGTR